MPSRGTRGRRRTHASAGSGESSSSTSTTGPTTPRRPSTWPTWPSPSPNEGYECHVLCSQGRYKPGEPQPPAHEVHEGVHIHRVPATSLGRTAPGPDDRLPELLRRRRGQGAALCPGSMLVVTLTTPPIIGLVGTLLKRLQGVAARLLEHGSPSRRQPRARADVADRSASSG